MPRHLRLVAKLELQVAVPTIRDRGAALPLAHECGNGRRNYRTGLYDWLSHRCRDWSGLRLMGALNRLDE
jgi:hypothetical protein